jgi:hypothetical protein
MAIVIVPGLITITEKTRLLDRETGDEQIADC